MNRRVDAMKRFADRPHGDQLIARLGLEMQEWMGLEPNAGTQSLLIDAWTQLNPESAELIYLTQFAPEEDWLDWTVSALRLRLGPDREDDADQSQAAKSIGVLAASLEYQFHAAGAPATWRSVAVLREDYGARYTFVRALAKDVLVPPYRIWPIAFGRVEHGPMRYPGKAYIPGVAAVVPESDPRRSLLRVRFMLKVARILLSSGARRRRQRSDDDWHDSWD